MSAESMHRKRFFFWLSFIWITLQVPFLSSAFRIDDPNILAIAKQIALRPSDPYGFRINWLGTPQSALDILANPPLVPAWLALWQALFPSTEISMHVAMLPFSLLALCSFAILASDFEVDPLISVSLLICSPAFFLGSQVLMPDVAMLSFFVSAVAFALVYEAQGDFFSWISSFVAAFLCPIAKYNGLVLLPVLIWLFITSKRKKGLIAILSAPILSLLLWNGFSILRYGKAHFLAISAFQNSPVSTPRLFILIGVLTTVGLGVLPLASIGFISKILARRRMMLFISAYVFLYAGWQLGFVMGSCLVQYSF